MDSHGHGTLYIVGTPIGNLADMTFRAIDTLKQVDVIAAEDTRHTGKLLHHFHIETPQTSYHAHNWRKRLPELLTRLQRGQNVALVSDAGMPGISDPGFELVEACAEADIPVVPIPGATAAIAALCISGLPPQPFVFEGFLPTQRSRSPRTDSAPGHRAPHHRAVRSPPSLADDPARPPRGTLKAIAAWSPPVN
jgi:16S rRNA (cytidine1402-2'-O)-methyltransferase